jgi:excisionase family DNA binding protein
MPSAALSLLSVGDVAEQLGLSPTTVQKLADAGSLETRRTPGGHRRITADSVERYRRQVASQAPIATPGAVAPQVLVVDDDELALTFLSHLIATHHPGCRIARASDGLQAAVQVERLRPQLVVTDLGMPHDGFRLVRLLREQPEYQGIWVAVFSSMTDRQISQKGGLPDGITFFAKPLQTERFLGYLDAFMRAHAGR